MLTQRFYAGEAVVNSTLSAIEPHFQTQQKPCETTKSGKSGRGFASMDKSTG